MPTPTSSEELPNFRDADHLLPAIAQEIDSGQVLMLAWMNRAAFDETVKSQVAVYFSRSRSRLWRKGETSGHTQHVEQILVDCDADTILLKVRQVGVACHDGFASCFYRALDENQAWQQIGQPECDPSEIYESPSKPDGA